MMKKSMRRIICLLLAALIMIPTSLPVFAEENEQPQTAIEETQELPSEESEVEEEVSPGQEEPVDAEEVEEAAEEVPEEVPEEVQEEIPEEPAEAVEETEELPEEAAESEATEATEEVVESEEVVEEEQEVVEEEPPAEDEESIRLAATTLPDEKMNLKIAKIEFVDTDPIVYDGTAKEPDFILIYKKDEESEEYRVILEDLLTVCDVVYSNNINAGTAKITITYKDDTNPKTTNKLVTEFTIEKAPQTIKLKVPSTSMYVYDKQTVKASGYVGTLTFKSSNKAIATVSAKGVVKAVDEGTVKITATASGDENHLEASKTVKITITYEDFDISTCEIVLEEEEIPYTSKLICPVVTITSRNHTLVQDVEYTVTPPSNSIKVGTYEVVITPIGHCQGEPVTRTYKIVKAQNPIAASKVNKTCSLEKQTFTLNASAKEGAKLTFKSSSTKITIDSKTGKDTIPASYLGSATITITASETENYVKTTKKVKVYARYMTKTRILEAIKGIMASWDGSWYGSAAYKQIINTYNAYADQIGAAKMHTDYAWCAATVSEAWITAGIAKYTGIEMSCGRFINIAKSNDAWNNDWKSCPKVGDAIIYSWDGSHSSHDHVGMVIAVSKDKKTFTTIEGNTNGSGMYNGQVGCFTRKVSYKYIQGFISYDYSAIADNMKYVKKIDDDEFITVSSIPAQTYTGSALKPEVTIKDQDKVLTLGTDYTLYYTNNTTPGTANVTIVGKGNYTGVRTLTFSIKAKYIWYHVIETSVRYRTSPGTSSTVAGTFKKNQDVKVIKGSAVKKDGYTWYGVMINSTTYYAASKYLKKGKYVSTTKDINDDSITVSKIGNKEFKAKALTPAPTIKDGDTKLVKDTDYTLSYSSNKWPGTATITITGIGKYSGTRKVTFKIVGEYTKYTAMYTLNYRNKPTISGTKKGTFAQGATVTVLNGYSKKADGYTWVIVKVGSKYYYAAKDYLK